jgi:hypothetical protein
MRQAGLEMQEKPAERPYMALTAERKRRARLSAERNKMSEA